jgi:hypothetical protein
MGHYLCIFRLAKATQGFGCEAKTDCLRIASPVVPTPPPRTSMIVQFPGLLRGESPSRCNLSINLYIMYAEFLPAGDISDDLQVSWQCTERRLKRVSACMLSLQLVPPSLWLPDSVPCPPFLPSYFSSALMAALLLPIPVLTITPL